MGAKELLLLRPAWLRAFGSPFVSRRHSPCRVRQAVEGSSEELSMMGLRAMSTPGARSFVQLVYSGSEGSAAEKHPSGVS